jgi:hypothetical protein
MVRLGAVLSSAAIVAASLASTTLADAYCRSTTCSGDCPRDADGCKTTGLPLSWPSLCVGVSLQADGTEFIAFEDTKRIIEDSFVAWSDLPCDGGGTASIAFTPSDPATCHVAEYDPAGGNANVVMFHDTKWSYSGEANNLAKTTVTFDTKTGAILDADLEINHAYNEYTIVDDVVVYDLQSIVTHEVGHFIGLDHSPDLDATMFAGYEEGSINPRSLELDDVAGACAAYPPDRVASCDPEPKGGFRSACKAEAAPASGGCSLSAREHDASTGLTALASALALVARARRARRAPSALSRARRKPNRRGHRVTLRSPSV